MPKNAIKSCLLLTLLGGCTGTHYSIVSPVDREIEAKGETVSMLPLIYEMTPVQGQLVVMVRNASGETVSMSAEASTPDGKTHPLPGGKVGPADALKLVLPPTQPPAVRRAGTVQFDVTDYTTGEHPGRFGGPVAPPLADNDADANAWHWDGELQLHVTVVQSEQVVEQTLRLRRR